MLPGSCMFTLTGSKKGAFPFVSVGDVRSEGSDVREVGWNAGDEDEKSVSTAAEGEGPPEDCGESFEVGLRAVDCFLGTGRSHGGRLGLLYSCVGSSGIRVTRIRVSQMEIWITNRLTTTELLNQIAIPQSTNVPRTESSQQPHTRLERIKRRRNKRTQILRLAV